MWVDKVTSLQDFCTGWFLDVLILESYLLGTQTSLGQKLSFQALPHAVGNVWIRLQNRWTFTEFYTLRKLFQVPSSAHPSQLSFADLPWHFFTLSCRVQHFLIPWLWAVAKQGMGLLWTSNVRTLGVWHFSLDSEISVRSLFFLRWKLLLFPRFPFWWQDLSKVSLWVNAGCRTQALLHGTEQCQAQPPPGSHRSPEGTSEKCLHRRGCQFYHIIVASGINCCLQNEVSRCNSVLQAIKEQVVALWLWPKAMD